MNYWGYCDICGFRGFMSHHKCPPMWECVNAEAVSYADKEDVWHEVFAENAGEAAEKFADWHDGWSTEYPAERDVAVRAADGTIEIYDVQVESIPIYTASKKADPVLIS